MRFATAPAGRDLGPVIPLADKAVATGSESNVAAFAAKEVERGIQEKFADLQRKRTFRPDDLAAGREYQEERPAAAKHYE